MQFITFRFGTSSNFGPPRTHNPTCTCKRGHEDAVPSTERGLDVNHCDAQQAPFELNLTYTYLLRHPAFNG